MPKTREFTLCSEAKLKKQYQLHSKNRLKLRIVSSRRLTFLWVTGSTMSSFYTELSNLWVLLLLWICRIFKEILWNACLMKFSSYIQRLILRTKSLNVSNGRNSCNHRKVSSWGRNLKNMKISTKCSMRLLPQLLSSIPSMSSTQLTS